MADLRDLPALRKLAEEQAADLLAAVRAQRGMLSDHAEGCVVEAHLDLLCDLSRPASRDAVARLVAEKVGLTCGATSPAFERVNDPAWMLVVWHDGECPAYYIDDVDEDVDNTTDPAEALRLIALHVLAAE